MIKFIFLWRILKYLQGVSPILLKQYRSSAHQFELKMVVASVIPLQERKSFHLFFLKHLNEDLKIELFLLQWLWLYFLLKSTYIYNQFSRVLYIGTGLLFDVFFKG